MPRSGLSSFAHYTLETRLFVSLGAFTLFWQTDWLVEGIEKLHSVLVGVPLSVIVLAVTEPLFTQRKGNLTPDMIGRSTDYKLETQL